jgi:hypothetical protein
MIPSAEDRMFEGRSIPAARCKMTATISAGETYTDPAAVPTTRARAEARIARVRAVRLPIVFRIDGLRYFIERLDHER